MSLLKLLFPPKCVLCHRILESHQEYLCDDCRIDAPECPVTHNKLSFLDSWVALWYYEDDVRRSLLRYKFHGARHYAPAYGRLLAQKIRLQYPDSFDIITWVPISSLRKLRRGFDQVELLADHVSKDLGIRPTRLLKKIRHNRPQSRILGQAQRRANVLGAYKLIDPQQVAGKRILLLDDIITTGSTMGECARMLLTAGADSVHGAAVAAVRHHDKNK